MTKFKQTRDLKGKEKEDKTLYSDGYRERRKRHETLRTIRRSRRNNDNECTINMNYLSDRNMNKLTNKNIRGGSRSLGLEIMRLAL